MQKRISVLTSKLRMVFASFAICVLINPAKANCRNILALGSSLTTPAMTLQSATTNMAQMLSTSTKEPLQLAIAQTLIAQLSMVQGDLSTIMLLATLQNQMKLPSDALAVAKQIDSSVPKSIMILQITIETSNRFIPLFSNSAFSQEAVTARDKLVELSRLLSIKCE